MGMNYSFAGETCGYSTALSGNSGIRMVMRIETVVCVDCVLVVDVVNGCQDWYMKDGLFQKSTLLRCPVCGGSHLKKGHAVSGERECLFSRVFSGKKKKPEGARAGSMKKNEAVIESSE